MKGLMSVEEAKEVCKIRRSGALLFLPTPRGAWRDGMYV